jgi:hypothetical protein
MNRRWIVAVVFGGVIGLLAAEVLLSAGFAQETTKSTDKKDREKAKGYLPPFYKDVVDGVQREKIYAIQDTYNTKINDLEAQIKSLREQRDAEIGTLLTPEQKKRLGELNDAARTKKAADNKAKASAKASVDAAK